MIRTVQVLLLAGVGVISVLAVASCGDRGTTEMPDATLPMQVPENTTEAFGVVIAVQSKNVHLEIPAVVEAVHVTDAQLVERGDVLVTVDLAEYESLLASLENRLTVERLALQRLRQTLARDHRHTSTELQRREIELETARAEAQRARAEYEREQVLSQKSVQQVAQLLIAAESSERRVAGLELELKQIRATHTEQAAALRGIFPQADSEAQSPLHSLDFEIKRKIIANLELEVATLKRSASHPHLDGARVIVEFDRAVVSNLEVSPGDRVDRAYPLLRLFDLTSVVVEAHVEEEFIRDVRLGDAVTIVPLADPSQESYGTVRRISGMAVYRSGQTIVPVIISIDDNRGLLLPNFNVDVIIYHG